MKWVVAYALSLTCSCGRTPSTARTRRGTTNRKRKSTLMHCPHSTSVTPSYPASSCLAYVQLVERRQADDSTRVYATPFLREFVSSTVIQHDSIQLTKFSIKEGNVHKIGMNQSVRDRLPKLPAKNVYASHCGPTPASVSRNQRNLPQQQQQRRQNGPLGDPSA